MFGSVRNERLSSRLIPRYFIVGFSLIPCRGDSCRDRVLLFTQIYAAYDFTLLRRMLLVWHLCSTTSRAARISIPRRADGEFFLMALELARLSRSFAAAAGRLWVPAAVMCSS